MGRPKRKPLDQLRTRIWFEFIRSESGFKSAYELGGGAAGADENIWYKYRAGTRVPTQRTLADIERSYPGSRDIFDSGPLGAKLWAALGAPHASLWDVIDITFPQFKKFRVAGLFGLKQYKKQFEDLLLPEKYRGGIDYIEYSKGVIHNYTYRAFLKDEILITPSNLTSFIAYWRLSSLVVFDMLEADYILDGIKLILDSDQNNGIFGSVMDKMINEYIKHYLKEEYSR